LTALFLESVANHRHYAAKITHTAEQLVMPGVLARSVPQTLLRLACTHRWQALRCIVTVTCGVVTLRRYQ
jgi:hypothetical protein